MKEEKVYRLARPVKTGLRHLIFSRFLIILLLLLLQLLLFAALYFWLNQLLPYFSASLTAFTIVMVVVLFNMQMDSSGKLTWLFLIAAFPIPGSIMLAFTRTNLGHRKMKKECAVSIAETMDLLPQPEGVLESLEKDKTGTEDLVTYLNRGGCFPAYQDSAVTYYASGERMFPAMLEELEKAEHFIFLEYFILEEGYMWGKILKILTEKAAAGVDVRVMYDGMCEMFQLQPGYWKLLEKQGIRSKPFAPIRPVVSSHYNYRDHRKIMVIDGRTAFTGGINLSDEYVNIVSKFGYWKDTGLRVRGQAAKSFTLMFLQLWNIDHAEQDLTVYLNGDCEIPEDASGTVIPYSDCPLDDEKVGETVYMDILYRATDYVHIMTPYLILDGEMEAALKYAAERGVDVKIILPGTPDKKSAYALAKSHYRSLTESGVKIYEYTPGFIHAKVFVSDDLKAVVGSINLDYRSLYHHFECAAYLYKCDTIAEIEDDFQKTLEECRAVTPELIENTSLYYRVLGRLLKFVAPLM